VCRYGGFALSSLMGLGFDVRAAQNETSRFKFANTGEVPGACPDCAVSLLSFTVGTAGTDGDPCLVAQSFKR
jgi:hypothetical protein